MTAAPQIKGWCPGALRPMPSGDGLLLRAKTLHPRLSSRQAREIASIARDCGNGLVDLTQRAQLQLRGADEARLGEAQQRLAALGLLAENAETERLLNFLVAPLAGLAPSGMDVDALIARLSERLSKDERLRALPGKFGFLIDDGGALGLADRAMDIRLEAHGEAIAVLADGASDRAFLVASHAAAETALALARAFLVLRKGCELELRRMRNVIASFGLDAIASAAGLTATRYRSQCRTASSQEIFGVRLATERSEWEGTFAGVGAPSGRLHADDLAFLADLGNAHGAGELRLTPWRAVLLPCKSRAQARAMIEAAANRGLIVMAEDPRLSVVACPGAPECPQALAPTRDLAARVAPLAMRLARGGAALHISGCAKGCAMPRAAKVTLVATSRGFDLVDEGGASDAPSMRDLCAHETERALQARIDMTREPQCPAH
jgi:precorrin-3B synthase